MRFHLLPRFPRSEILVLPTLLSCFAIVLGAGDLRKPVARETEQSGSAPMMATVSFAQPDETGENITEPSRFAAELAAVFQQMGAPAAPSANPDQGRESNPTVPQSTIVGIWAPDATSCSLQNFRDGLLPTVINLDGASAGDTFCGFKNQTQTETGWRVDALCSNKREQWTTRVHLIMKGDRLIWKSKRGSQAYTRCMNDLRMAEVP